jgi:hypothetical protein
MCVCIIEFVVVLFKMLSCNALTVGKYYFPTVSKQARTTHHRQRITWQQIK